MRRDGHVTLGPIFARAGEIAPLPQLEDTALALCRAYNGTEASRSSLAAAAERGDRDAANTIAWLRLHDPDPVPVQRLTEAHAARLHRQLLADPQGFLASAPAPYPASAADQHWGFDTGWIRDRLELSRIRLRQCAAAQCSDLAILAGNGPSLNRTDWSLLEGREVYVSNYAVSHDPLGQLARGVAVTNYFVANQAPTVFHPITGSGPAWRFYPVWLSHVLPDTPETVWLNALGGKPFFSGDPAHAIAWHSTVSYFWLQILFHLGYRKVLLIGFDHSYTQPATAREGDLLRQAEDDTNHFDPAYFRGKSWQAADTDNMARVYELAKRRYEAEGREIVNCTEGGALEVFRRAPLGAELGGT